MPCIRIVSIADCYGAVAAQIHGRPCQLQVGQEFELADRELSVGRSPDNDLVLELSNVCLFHFRIAPAEQGHVFTSIRGKQLYNGAIFGGSSVLADGDTFNAAGIGFQYFAAEPGQPVIEDGGRRRLL